MLLVSPLGPSGSSTVLEAPMEGERSTRNMVTVYLDTMYQPRVYALRKERPYTGSFCGHGVGLVEEERQHVAPIKPT
jgi:hypothetical protein